MLILLPGCQSRGGLEKIIQSGPTGANEASAQFIITFRGEDRPIEIGNILQLDEVVLDIAAQPRDGEDRTIRRVRGIMLEDVFQSFISISVKDPLAITLISGDGYSIRLDRELLQTRDLILAYEIDGKSLEAEEKPFRFVIADVFEMYWVKNLVQIEIVE